MATLGKALRLLRRFSWRAAKPLVETLPSSRPVLIYNTTAPPAALAKRVVPPSNLLQEEPWRASELQSHILPFLRQAPAAWDSDSCPPATADPASARGRHGTGTLHLGKLRAVGFLVCHPDRPRCPPALRVAHHLDRRAYGSPAGQSAGGTGIIHARHAGRRFFSRRARDLFVETARARGGSMVSYCLVGLHGGRCGPAGPAAWLAISASRAWSLPGHGA